MSLLSTTVKSLPVEITREIFLHLLSQHQNIPGTTRCKYINNRSTCTCWQLDLLSISMVCKSWYAIAVEMMLFYQEKSSNGMPYLPLLNYASQQRTYPFRSRLKSLFAESRLSNLIFHHLVRHLVIDFASFDTIRREKQKNNSFIKRKIHHVNALADMTELLKLCTHTEQLDIICDAGFTGLLSQHSHDNNSIATTVSILEQQLVNNNRVKRLDLIGFNPIQRCPCCAGRDWDKHLIPLINCLSLDTLVLQHVLPSEQVLASLAEQKNLKRIVLYRSLITIPESQVTKDANGNFVRSIKRRGSSNGVDGENIRINSISRIPQQLWDQVTSISIYEDVEDASLWPNRRYLYDLVDRVGPQLEEFTLQFGTKEENESSLVCLDKAFENNLSDPFSILHKLKSKSVRISLINVPGNPPIR